MNKKVKIFLKVIYYISTFSLGLFLALYLPNVLYYKATMSTISESLTNENYSKAMIYIGGYFNDQYVYEQRFGENSGIVLFETVTISNNTEPNTNAKLQLNDSYSGFIYNVKKEYNVYKTSSNETKLVVIDKEGKETNISLLDRDKNSDGVFDSNNTYEDYEFIFLDLSKTKLKSVNKLKFVNCIGETYKEFDLSNLNLIYDSQFFTDVHLFTDVFNNNNNEPSLTTLDKDFRAKSSHYLYSNYGSGDINVTTKAVFIILGYFLLVYLIADSGLGKRYVYRGCKFVICKIFKIEPKPKKETNNTYSSDYYSAVTLSLNLDNLTEEQKASFPEEVEIKYNNENEIMKFVVKKEEGYKQTERVKAGIYTNMMSSLPKEEYYFSGMLSKLKVSGFKMNILLIVRKRGD